MTKIKNKIIKNIHLARKKNNTNWMKILDLSLKYAPKQTRKVLLNINKQDNKISNLLKKLTNKKI